MLESKWDLFAVGDASVDTYIKVPFIVGPDQKAIGEWLGVYGGGMAANFAAAAAHSGAAAGFMTVIGDDAAGIQLINEMNTHGVDTSAVQVLPGMRTFQCFVQLDPTGEKALFGAAPGRKVPAVEDISNEIFSRSRYVYVLADDLDWAREVIDIAKECGVLVAVDLERTAVESDLAAALAIAAMVDIVFTNVSSFVGVGLTDRLSILNKLVDAGAQTVVVTDGGRGALARNADTCLVSTGLVVPVVDSTGAGDAHNGALLGALLRGHSLAYALALATAMGALCVQYLGPRGYGPALKTDLPALLARAHNTITTLPTS